jgi:hypothetical protein
MEPKKRASNSGQFIKGHKLSPESIKKMKLSIAKGFESGRKGPNWGRKFHLEHRKKLSAARVGRFKGKDSPNWRGGKSCEPYSIDWTETLRRSIRERDNYVCQLCTRSQGDRVLSVHHIDYNKKNCNPNNLITLCCSCNFKVNYSRDYWFGYFKKNA